MTKVAIGTAHLVAGFVLALSLSSCAAGGVVWWLSDAILRDGDSMAGMGLLGFPFAFVLLAAGVAGALLSVLGVVVLRFRGARASTPAEPSLHR